MNKKIATVSLIILMAIAFTFMPLELVLGQGTGQIGVTIYQVFPETLTGPVGQFVNILGSIYTSNGTYEIWLGSNLVAKNKADGYYVETNFTIPEAPSGTYNLILRDTKININDTQRFEVTPGYSINAIVPSSTAQLQEGNTVEFNVTITGGQPSASYFAKISVMLPRPLNTIYSKIISLGTPDQKGTAHAQFTYPDSSFQPEGSLTDYVGTYTVFFNQTESLASNQFTVGFTDTTQYHRGQTMTIHATGYQPNQESTLSITSVKTGSSIHTGTLTSSAEGIITSTWVVSSEASVGDYTIKITPPNNQKLIQDTQVFTVPGYLVQIRTLNLAGQITPQIQVQALDASTNTAYNSTSGSTGIAFLRLEKGIHVLTALWNGVNVGVTNVTITGEGTYDLRCALTNLKIKVQDSKGILMSFVNLNINYQYVTAGGQTKTGSTSGQTDVSGTFILNSTLSGVSYTINASIYNQVFNRDNNTVSNLPAQPQSEVTIICPSRTLTINLVDYNLAPITEARIELVEVTSGLFYSSTTDSVGAVTNEVTFGLYRTRVYKDQILINETVIDAFSASQKQIRCTLYGIQVSVSVVDFFGQPIPNANVTLNGPVAERFSAMTMSDGTATFNNVIGGDMQIVAFAAGDENNYQAATIRIDQPTAIQMKIDKYILLGPLLIQASALLTIVIILVAIILFAIVEIFKRKSKSASES